ncbi:MAG: hypothetical protein V7K27_23490 [Nostoc sp.]
MDKVKNHIFRKGTEKAHWCQLKVKASLEPAFRDSLEKKSLTGNACR